MLHAWSSALCFFLPYWQKKIWSAGSVQHALACTNCFYSRAPPSTALCLCLHSRGEHSIRAGQPASKCNCMVEVWTHACQSWQRNSCFNQPHSLCLITGGAWVMRQPTAFSFLCPSCRSLYKAGHGVCSMYCMPGFFHTCFSSVGNHCSVDET